MRKRILLLLIPALFLLLTLCASADELILPAGLVTIEEEAFAGDLALDEVILPEGLATIEARAFAGSGITRIYLPESINYIAPDAFDQCLQVTGYGPDFTYASDYFDEHGLNFEHTPRHIALLIGNGDYNGDGDTEDFCDLSGPLYDVNALEQALLGLNPAWEVTKKANLSANDFLSWIDTVFGDSRTCDICLLHYSGHCAQGGQISCVDGNTVTAQTLADRLNQAAKGKVIVQLDCCYSGAMITPKGSRSVSLLADFNTAVISAFSSYTLETKKPSLSSEGITPKNGELIQEKFIVLSACAENQESVELSASIDGENFSCGLMTYALVRALGCSYPGGNYGGVFYGDRNSNHQLSLSEAVNYITSWISNQKQRYIQKLESQGKTYNGEYDQITSSHGDGSFVLFER